MLLITEIIREYFGRAMLFLAGALLAFAMGAHYGGKNVQVRWDADKAAQAVRIAEQKIINAEEGDHVVTKYIDRVQVVHEKGQTIIKKVASLPDDCRLSVDLRLLHDEAAIGLNTSAAANTDARTCDPAVSTCQH